MGDITRTGLTKCVFAGIILLITLISVSADTTTLLFSGFETAITNNFTASAGWSRTTGNFLGGTASALLTGGGGSATTLTSSAVDTSGCDRIIVQVYTYDHLIDNNDNAMFQLEGPDNTWNDVSEVGLLTEDSWALTLVNDGTTTYKFNGFQIRFTDTGLADAGETLGVDNVSIICFIDTAAPSISSVAESGITGNSATITWTTDENANSSVRYGRTLALSDGTSTDATMLTSHSVGLSSLLGDTLYYYNVTTCDPYDNCNQTGPNSFTTLDINPPAISAVSNASVTSDSATVTWSTDENSNSTVRYGTTIDLLDGVEVSASLVTSHSVPLSSLIFSTPYYFNVTSCDAGGYCATAGPYVVTTAPPADVTAPVISGIVHWGITGTSARINWTTDEDANSTVQYGLTTALSSRVQNTTRATGHNLLLTGLSEALIYYYNVSSCDAFNNCKTDGIHTFGTPDVTAPVVSINTSLSNWYTSDTTPAVSFNFSDSNTTAACSLYFDNTEVASQAALNRNTNYALTSSVLAAKNYSVNVNCTDASGNEGTSSAIRIIIDNVAPAVNINISLNNTATQNTQPPITFNFTDTLSSTANCTLFFNGSAQGTALNAANNTALSITANPALTSGTYVVNVTCMDKGGMVGASGKINFNVSVATYVATDAPAGTKLRLRDSPTVDVTSTAQSGIEDILAGVGGSTSNYSAIIRLNFSANLSMAGLVINTSRALAKSVVHNASTLPGFVSVSLLIPRVLQSGRVYICPGAASLSAVNNTCPGLVNISVGQTVSGMTVSTTVIDSESYYLVSNISGTGGAEGEPTIANPMQCFFVESETCPAGSAKLIGVMNDTGGYNNAHAQNYTLETYNNSICCNDTNASITISSGCPGQANVTRLFAQDNSHIEAGNNTNYSITACLSSNWKRVSCYYPVGTCDPGYACVLSMASSDGDNSTNAHLGDCDTYSQKVCCALVNRFPSAPALIYPAADNYSVFERKINFTWAASVDPDGDGVSYNINVSCGGSCPAACTDAAAFSLSGLNYSTPQALCVDTDYTWTVDACDTFGDCNSSVRSFRIPSVLDLMLITNSTDFGSLSIGATSNTLSGTPAPLVVRNMGNVIVNVTTNATSLFVDAPLDSNNYQFQAAQNETGSFVTACSQTTFANIDDVPKNIFCNLSYVDVSDEGKIHINITVPSSEPSGAKSSVLQLNAVSAE